MTANRIGGIALFIVYAAGLVVGLIREVAAIATITALVLILAFFVGKGDR